ncbi:hypothetical protein RDABS01_011011 [Bienertia sinuspersici]
MRDEEDESFYRDFETGDDDDGTYENLCDEDIEDTDEDMPMVQDYFDPYEGLVWDTMMTVSKEDNYFNKLYENGELYTNQEWGKIELEPWQLFTDKLYLRNIVRDYAIQCGFSIVVDKANNSRYTVQCAAQNCAWRLHASKLPDGMTWLLSPFKILSTLVQV